MLEKTLRRLRWSVAISIVLCSTAWSKVPVTPEPEVTVSVHNDAGIPFEILAQAESDASRIFRLSGLAIRWLNCSVPSAIPGNSTECMTADFPRHLQLRLASHALDLNQFTMGISYLSADGTGCYADLFYHHAQLIHESSHVSVATILGHGLAHEIGHLLLGNNSHAPAGIMRARWQPADLASASQGRLLFSPLESQQMRNKLLAWHTRAQDAW